MATGFNTQIGSGEYRLQFETDDKEYFLLMQETARRCVDGGHMTNAGRIRSMSDEELAEFISEITDNCETNTECKQHCYGCDIEYCVHESCLKWLQQPAEKKKEDD